MPTQTTKGKAMNALMWATGEECRAGKDAMTTTKRTPPDRKSSASPLPSTPRGWALHRAGLNCRIGRDALNSGRNVPAGISQGEYALYTLLAAVEDIALALQTPHTKEPK